MLLLSAASGLAAGVYGIGQKHGVWSFRDPAGRPFWSLGICCTDTGVAPGKVDAKNPGYSGLSLYPSETAWATATASRLRSWGFNSLGGWSDADKFRGASAMPFFPVLHLGAYDQAPWHDMFAPQFLKAIDGAAKTQVEKLRDDPNLVGYFTDNELGWWGDTLFTTYFAMPASSPGKVQLVALMKRHYGGDFSKLAREWTTRATGFENLAAETKIYLKPGTRGISVTTDWTGFLARHYYRSVRDAVRRYDPKHLILGDRYCQYYDPAVVAASKDYIDVASTNLGAEWNDGTVSRFFLDTIHSLTGKPVVISEFYMAAMENASGNRNSSGGFPVVQTQRQRAAAFTRYLQDLARRPYVIGAHWFQFYDEPPKGRGDGEDYNMGLVDIRGEAYPELTAASRSLAIGKWRREGMMRVGSGIPAASGQGVKNWPRDRAFCPPVQKGVTADLYATWEKGALNLGLFVMDFADAKLFEDGRIPEGERPLLRISIDGKVVEVRFGGKGKAVCLDPAVRLTEIPGVKHTLTVRVPVRGMVAGRPVRFSASWWSHSRARRMDWRVVSRAK